MLIPIFYFVEAIYGKIFVLVTEEKEAGEKGLRTMLLELQILPAVQEGWEVLKV